tara:strand:- start:183 stop:485 length:303 start_codon:yes stop_codon:yes gene_type:complete
MPQGDTLEHGSLWASVFVIGVAIIFTASRHSQTAAADSVISKETFTLTTAPSGQGSDYLYLIDNQTSMLLVYDIPDPQNRQFIRPVATWSLPALFNSVRN